MNIFELDPIVTLGLARELESQAQPVPLSRPNLPGGAVADFCAALTAAHDNILSRHEVLRGDLAQLADVAVATTHATLTADRGTGSAFVSLNPVGA